MPSAFQRKARTIPGASSSAGPATSSEQPSSSASPPIPTHPTLRPSPFPQQQPLPLFSTGLSAINDILTGVGLPSGCLALFQPLQSDEADDDDHERTRLEAGAAYADLVLRYSAAQGIAHGHRVLVIGEGVQSWCRGLMGWAGEVEQARHQEQQSINETDDQSSQADTVQDDTPLASRNNLKSAFRYDKLQKIQASQGRDDRGDEKGAAPFVHPFDLTMRMSDATLDAATKSGRLVALDVADVDGDDDAYEAIWRIIQDVVSAGNNDDTTTTPLRIILPSIGSPLYAISPHTTHATASYRLLLRLKSLTRSLSWPNSDTTATMTSSPRPSITLGTLSPTLLLHSPSISPRLSHLSDATLSFSSFASDARLRAMFCDSTSTTAFTGSLKIVKTPTVGSLRSSSIRASTLRGMSSSGALDSEGTTENSLGFKVRRKGFKVEVMGRDLVAGGEERNANDKPKRPEMPQGAGGKSAVPVDKEQARQTRAVHVDKEQHTQQPTNAAASMGVDPPPPAPAQTQLKGIAALRARGLQAASRREADDGEEAAAKRLQGLKLAAKQEW